MKSALKALYVLLMTTPILLLPLLTTVSCQEQSGPATPVPAPAPSTSTPSPSEPQQEYISDQIIVKFKDGTSVEAQEQLHQKLGTKLIHTSPAAGFQVLQIPEGKTVEEMVARYSEQSIVEYAEPNYIEHISPESQ